MGIPMGFPCGDSHSIPVPIGHRNSHSIPVPIPFPLHYGSKWLRQLPCELVTTYFALNMYFIDVRGHVVEARCMSSDLSQTHWKNALASWVQDQEMGKRKKYMVPNKLICDQFPHREQLAERFRSQRWCFRGTRGRLWQARPAPKMTIPFPRFPVEHLSIGTPIGIPMWIPIGIQIVLPIGIPIGIPIGTWNSDWNCNWTSNLTSHWSSNWISNWNSRWNSNWKSNWNSRWNSRWNSSWNSGLPIGIPIGRPIGIPIGLPIGIPIGIPSGIPIGILIGIPIGSPSGSPIGIPIGSPIASPIGIPIGIPIGFPSGIPIGISIGIPVGIQSEFQLEFQLGFRLEFPFPVPAGNGIDVKKGKIPKCHGCKFVWELRPLEFLRCWYDQSVPLSLWRPRIDCISPNCLERAGHDAPPCSTLPLVLKFCNTSWAKTKNAPPYRRVHHLTWGGGKKAWGSWVQDQQIVSNSELDWLATGIQQVLDLVAKTIPFRFPFHSHCIPVPSGCDSCHVN